MRRHSRAIVALGMTAALAAVAACASVRIRNVLADPGRYATEQVTLSGRVVESYSIAGRGIYRIEDKTGQLWVVSTHGVPAVRSRVEVRGTVREAFNLGSFDDRLMPRGLGTVVVLMDEHHDVRSDDGDEKDDEDE